MTATEEPCCVSTSRNSSESLSRRDCRALTGLVSLSDFKDMYKWLLINQGLGKRDLLFVPQSQCENETRQTEKIYWAKKPANLPKIQPTGKKEYEQASTAGRDK